MLDHESFVNLSYYSLLSVGIPVPRLGTAILINDSENAEKICDLLLKRGYVLLQDNLKQQYRGQWKKMLKNPRVCKDSQIILVNEEFKCIIDWNTLKLGVDNIKSLEPFFSCVDDYLVLESGGTMEEEFVEMFKEEVKLKPENLGVYETWEWFNKLQWKHLSIRT